MSGLSGCKAPLHHFQEEGYNKEMKVKKYPQSHLLITGNSTKIIIDPGYITFDKGYKMEEFQGMDGYLITHHHGDHMDPERIKEIVGKNKVYGNSDVVEKLKGLGVESIQVENGQPFKIGEFEIIPYNLAHFPHPLGNPMPPNTGYVVGGVFFHAGDGYELAGVEVDNVALPIGHPSLSTTQVLNFARSLKAKLVIPIHYDVYLRDPEELIRYAKELSIEVRPLKSGEETVI